MQNQHEASLKAHQDAKEKLRENIENANEKVFLFLTFSLRLLKKSHFS